MRIEKVMGMRIALSIIILERHRLFCHVLDLR
jgi:hypothetical protein